MQYKSIFTLTFRAWVFSILIMFSFTSLHSKENSQPNINKDLRKTLFNKITKELDSELINAKKSSTTTPKTRVFNLTAKPANIKLLNNKKIPLWTYNGQLAPILRITLGEKIKINFKNQLPQPTTIHFHGIRVPNNMDGVPNVTQPLIPPNGKFTYSFTPKDSGTYWFHPHHRGSEQIGRGLYGVIIVEKPKQKENDLVLILDDWRLLRTGDKLAKFNNRHDAAMDGRFGNLITLNGKYQPNLDFILKSKIPNRIRIINTANARVFHPEFNGVDAWVLAVDGKEVTPYRYKGMNLSPGNRLDLQLDLTSHNNKYPIQIIDSAYQSNYLLGNINIKTSARFKPAKLSLPRKANNHNNFVRNPILAMADKLLVDKTFNLNITGSMMSVNWRINGETYPDVKPIKLANQQVYRFRYYNQSRNYHPMHLHGTFFKVISRDGKKVDEKHWRDTVLVWPKETVEIVTVFQEKGKWLNHCHAQEHADAGMISVLEIN